MFHYMILEENPIFVRDSNYINDGSPYQKSNTEGSYPQENVCNSHNSDNKNNKPT